LKKAVYFINSNVFVYHSSIITLERNEIANVEVFIREGDVETSRR